MTPEQITRAAEACQFYGPQEAAENYIREALKHPATKAIAATLNKDRDAITAEVARLREALKGMLRQFDYVCPTTAEAIACGMARDALAAGQDDKSSHRQTDA